MHEWLYIEDGSGLAETAVPAAPAESTQSWHLEPRDTSELADRWARLADLQRRGLTGAMVMADAVMHRLAPHRDGMRMFPPGKHALQQSHVILLLHTALVDVL